MTRTATRRRTIIRARKALSLTLAALGLGTLTWTMITAINYGTDPLGNELIPTYGNAQQVHP